MYKDYAGNLEVEAEANASDAFVIQTNGLSKTYKGVAALKSLGLKVPRHSIFAFLGLNGAGKSTTIKLLLGLAAPTSGSGTIFGYDIVRDNLAIRKRVGYLAQDPRFYEDMTSRQILNFAARFFYAGPTSAIEERVSETLELVGLTSKADRPIRGFSGGERQRLGLAQAQINHPDLLILDEPAAAIDPVGRRDILEIMQRLRKNTTIFYSTHLLDDVQRVSDMVAIMKSGELLVQAPIDQLLADTDQITYVLTLKGPTSAAYTRVMQQPWVSHITAFEENNQTRWHVLVNDENVAQTQLLPLVSADGQVSVVEFGRSKHELEEIFVNLVEGGKNGH